MSAYDTPRLTRRQMFRVLIALPVAAAFAEVARSQTVPGLRGALDAGAAGIRPAASEDQGPALQALLETAAQRGDPVYLPPGDYRVGRLALPDGTVLTGAGAASRLLATGEGPALLAQGAARITLSGLAVLAPADAARPGVVRMAEIGAVTMRDCLIDGGAGHGLSLEGCGGRIEANTLTRAAGAGLYAVDSKGLSIIGNTVSDCGNGGILVHRFAPGEDGTLISGNRVERTGATDGGTGQNGNGINVYQAHGVVVTGNHVSGSAFSAIRSNGGSGVIITANQCLDSGETAIYSEFSFVAAVISDNQVDGAANGILVVNLDEGGRIATVSGNIVRNLTTRGPYRHEGAGFGIGIAAEADTAITGNVIEGAPKWGIMLGWGPFQRNLTVTGNVVREAGTAVAVSVVEGAGAALIASNILACREAAIRGYRWNEAVTGDLIDGADGFSMLTVTGNRRG
ncbi:twin-arg-translocated uncharacterized repeat-containing protein [Rhizobium sp. RU20A]|uniref:TIGR03808 family TAT-translocated repetitive protein n=1 Tax=Rhizobium sp. RU20A TaxID=1907412 RepID=UPI00095625AE|nr:TIGR03808 family TAT-translocated repetitive protein [Rhizobium sp. RU20A]SIR17665.1 twin-arg-translocated uncharacterized repeat-containing protein [Rhizobium sp. RU20A]